METTLKELLNKRNINLDMLATSSGVSLQRINFLKSGKIKPGSEEAKKISDALEVKAEDIFPLLREGKTEEAQKKLNVPFKMLPGLEEFVPELRDGFYILKSVTFTTNNMVFPDGGMLQRDQQWIIGTGIDYNSFAKEEKLFTYSLDKYLFNNELWSHPFPVNNEGHLSVALYNHGKAIQLTKGLEISKLRID